MKCLVYLMLTGTKNSLKELPRKPGKLIGYLLLLALVAGLIVLSGLNTAEVGSDTLPLFWLRGIFFAFMVLVLVASIRQGLTSGSTIFEMSDVNLLFVSPLNPRAILLYGLVRMTKSSFLAGIFILFQGGTLARFGVGFGGLLIILFAFILSMVAQSILSLVIYSATNGRPRRQTFVRVLTVLVFVPLLAYFGIQFFATADAPAALQATVSSPLLGAIPIAGWAAAGVSALLSGQVPAGVGWLALPVLAAAGMLVYITLSRADYYEDVLVATETAFERKRAAEAGDLQATSAAGAARVRVRAGKTGIAGSGASTLFYKHLRETFRQNRLGFFGLSTIIIFVAVTAFAIALREELDVVSLLQILMWVQIMLIGTGRGLRELYTHYIYLIPQPPLKKVIWSNMELVFKTLLDSVLFLGVPGLMLASNPLLILAAMLTYTLFAMLLLGLNYLSMRFDFDLSAGLTLTLYFIAVVLIMAPGLVPALVVGFMVGGTWGAGLGLLILSAWQLLAALGCFALAKGVLHNCDMPTAKPTRKT